MINYTVPKQMKLAEAFVQNLIYQYNIPKERIILAGHSLGGSITQYICSKNNLQGVTFNAYGIGHLIPKGTNIYEDNIINYCNPKDIVANSNAINLLGECFEIPNKQYLDNSIKEIHSCESMGPLHERKRVDKYSIQKNWKDNINERIPLATSKDVHVDAYKRSDGTPVKEHTRSMPNELKSKRLSEMTKEELDVALDYLM